MSFKIKTSAGRVIAGFSKEHQIVQIAGSVNYEKQFKTRAAAQRFINTYADKGYGLTSDAVIFEER